MLTDVNGVPLQVGQHVVYAQHSYACPGVIKKINPKSITVEITRYKFDYTTRQHVKQTKEVRTQTDWYRTYHNGEVSHVYVIP